MDGEWRFGTTGSKIAILRFDESVDDCYIGRRYNTVLTSYQGQWIYLVATSDGTTSISGNKIYLNGAQIDDTNHTSNSASFVSVENLNGNVRVGRYSAAYADGSVDDLRFFNHELTLSEIQRLYNNGVGAEDINHNRRSRYLNGHRSSYRNRYN